MKNVVVALSMLVASSAFADVTVIASKLIGEGQLIGNTVTIYQPKIMSRGYAYNLLASDETGKTACEMMGMNFKSFSEFPAYRTVVDLKDGALTYKNHSDPMNTLSCTTK